MKTSIRYFLTLLLALLGWTGCEIDPALTRVLPEGSEVVHDCRNEKGDGIVIVRHPDGTLTAHMADDISDEMASGSPGVTNPPFYIVPWSSRPFEGNPIHCQIHSVINRQGSEEIRVVIVLEVGQDPDQETVTLTFDAQGHLLQTVRKKGKFIRSIYNQSTQEKVFLTETAEAQHWVVINLRTGRKVAESVQGFPLTDEIVDVEKVGDHILVIQKWRGGTWVRVKIYGPDDQLLHAIDIPGEYIASVPNATHLKAIVTQFRGTVCQDLVDVRTGVHSNAVGVNGMPQNGIDGIHKHLQYDKGQGQDRFVEIVQNTDRNETVVRILNGAGQIVSTQILPGIFKAVVKIHGKKVIALERGNVTDAVVIDLSTGRQGPVVTTVPGAYTELRVDPSGGVTLKTPIGSSPVIMN